VTENNIQLNKHISLIEYATPANCGINHKKTRSV